MLDARIRDVIVTIIDDNMPYQNQVDIFYSADLIVSVHGSQLQNLMFMQPGSCIIEIFPKGYYHEGQNAIARYSQVYLSGLENSLFPPRNMIQAVNSSSMSASYDICRKKSSGLTAHQCMRNDECRCVFVIFARLVSKSLPVSTVEDAVKWARMRI